MSLSSRLRTLVVVTSLTLLIASAVNAASVSKLAGALKVAAKQENLDQVRTLLGELGRSGEEKAVGVILQALGMVPAHEVMKEAIDALVALGPDSCAKTFDKILKRLRDPELGAVLIAASARMAGEQASGWLVKGLETGEYYLYRNAIPPLVERKARVAIPALIDLLERVGYDPSNESYMVRDALIALTGQDFENIPDWRSWWKINEETFDPATLGQQQGATGVARKMPGGFKKPEFFGVEVPSNRIVFVVDVSGSMQLYDNTGEKIGEGPDHKTKERLARLKFHLAEAVKNLPTYSYFNIVAYSDVNRIFQPKGSVPATDRWKKQALEFVQALRAFGPTHTDDALGKAFDDREVDTIFLLSDGAPTKLGKKTKDLIVEIHEMVAKLNQLAKIKIYTFGFEGEPQYPPGTQKPPPPQDPDEDAPTIEDLINFLKKLAGDHGGEYHPIQ